MDGTETKMLEGLFDELCKSAISIFHSEDEVAPFIFIFPRDGGIVPLIPIKEDKDLVSRFVQYACHKLKPIAGAIVAEAWAVTLDKDGIWDGTPPSKRLDRVEILQVSLYSKSVNRMKSWKIIRDEKTKALEDYGELFTDRVESRFFGDYFRVDS